MAQEDTGESKVHDPTPRRLEELRRKGDLPRSADLATAVGYGAILLALLAAGQGLVDRLGGLGVVLIGQADALAPLFFAGHGAAPSGALLVATVRAMLPLVAVPVVMVTLALLAQRGLVFTPSKLAPKLSRISLVQNAKQKFGLSGLVEFFKSFAKLLIFSSALGLYIAASLERIVLAVVIEPRQAVVLLGRLALEFLALVVAIALLVGALDLLWQIVEHRRRNRMSHKDLRDETKNSEGDPYLKERRRQKGMAIAQNSMIARVPEASVVIVNPTHYAVALEWRPTSLGAPVCVAKGVDAVAHRIREAAEAARIPVRRDAVTARALHASVEIGEEIGVEHYAQVAAAIRFAEDVRARARRSVL
jgi:flagellar biosynthetic protein FlhB